MDYIRINEGKLKITLDAKDLEDWDIRIDELDYANPCARAIFEEFLAYARLHLGFDSSGHKVLIHLHPSREGGCEIFISRIDQEEVNERETSPTYAYCFKCLDDLLGACHRLNDTAFRGESSAWFDGDGRWFLTLSGRANDAASLTFISEYGEEADPEALSLYLCEYAEAVCHGNATEILGKI